VYEVPHTHTHTHTYTNISHTHSYIHTYYIIVYHATLNKNNVLNMPP